jgi:hypothetical protein
MSCSACQKTSSASDIVNQSLQQFKEHLIPGEQSQDKRPDTIIPLSKERLDMAAYTFLFYMENGCAKENNPFWGNVNVRELLLKHRFEDHFACHKASCFKKGCECRFLFHLCQQPIPTFTKIKVTRIKKKYCGIHLMDQLQKYVPLLFYQKDPWVANMSIHIMYKSCKLLTSIQTYKLEMYPMFSTVHCTQAN